MRFNRKRYVLVVLLLVLSVSAVGGAVINGNLYMQANVAAETPIIMFVAGDDSGASAADAQIGTNGTYVRLAGLGGWPNATRIYEQAVNITNTETRVDRSLLS